MEGSRQCAAEHIDGEIAPAGEVWRHFAAARAEFDDSGFGGGKKLLGDGADESSEDGLELLGGVEVAFDTEGIAGTRVVAPFGMIERGVHEAMERDGAATLNLKAEELGKWSHAKSTAALRRAREEFDEIVVEAVVEILLEGPGELRVSEVARMNGRDVGVKRRRSIANANSEFDAGRGRLRAELDERMFVAGELGFDSFQGGHPRILR